MQGQVEGHARELGQDQELGKPGRDPRETFVPFSFRQDIRTLNDLEPGMVCPGIVIRLDKQQIALSMRSGSNADVARGPRPPQDRGGGGPNQGPRPSAPPPQQRPFNNPFAGLDRLRGK